MMGRLYTEASIQSLPRGSELVLESNDVVTPSALDAAFTLRIRVRRADTSTAAGGATREGAEEVPVWRAMLSRDGTYVVDVRAGRATVHQLTPDGPTPVRSGGSR